jgi:pimeloyl-ACP methyl ester carboxylesterase
LQINLAHLTSFLAKLSLEQIMDQYADSSGTGFTSQLKQVAWQDKYFTSQDGLRLYVRDYEKSGDADLAPVICLSGLTRNSSDFHELASRMAPARRVVAMDYRGRGRSEYTKDWSTYTPLQEMDDTFAMMAALGLHDAIIAGTSRGGLIGMMMAAARPASVRALILNDIGPEVNPQGLLRIHGYLGVTPKAQNWDDAVYLMKSINRGFNTLHDDEWLAWARRTYIEKDGFPFGDYDKNLRKTFASHDELTTSEMPTLWPQFNAMKNRPVLVLRGEHSDILAARTVEKMLEVKPNMLGTIVKDRGHVPFLDEPEALESIEQLLKLADAAGPGGSID